MGCRHVRPRRDGKEAMVIAQQGQKCVCPAQAGVAFLMREDLRSSTTLTWCTGGSSESPHTWVE
jgi:hypothetical protein